MTELSHDRPEPDPRIPDAPHSLEEKLEQDPAQGQDVERQLPEAPDPEPRGPGGPKPAEDLVTDEGVNEGLSELAAEE